MRSILIRLLATAAVCCVPPAAQSAFAAEGPPEATAPKWQAPTRPDRKGPVPGELGATADAWQGVKLPPSVASCPDGPATAVASFTAVPTSATLDLLADRAWAVNMGTVYPIHVARLEDRIAWLESDNERAWSQVENLSRDPFLQRPGTQRTIGAVGGAGSVLLGAWAISAVATR